jgi:predicted flap endonuclease-1-like 5' DNA nuclease
LHDLAQLKDSDIARPEDEVIRFSGRIKRNKWVE